MPPKRKCPCCNEDYSETQIRRHLKIQRERLARELANSFNNDEGGHEGADGADIGGAINEGDEGADPGDQGAGMEELAQLAAAELGLNDAEPAPDDVFVADAPHGVVGDYAPVQGVIHNPESDASEDDDDDEAEHDPGYVEHDIPPGLDAIDEPRLADEDIRQMLALELGDLAADEWAGMYQRYIGTRDENTLRLLATRLRTHFSRQTWLDLCHGVCRPLRLPSEVVAWRRLRILANLESASYDCCINSCICYLGRFQNLNACPYCQEARRNAQGKVRRSFRYTPLIPQLRGFFQSQDMADKLTYRLRAEQEHDPTKILDVFDGDDYRRLRQTEAYPGYRFFNEPQDLALGISTDGFSLFKRRRKGHSTAWPIILIIYNLHPDHRVRLENVICVGVVPGPKQCKDLNSFLIPLLDELLALERGVQSGGYVPGEREKRGFKQHAHVIIGFGDIPAIAKMTLVKAHNAITPCRACLTQGIKCQHNSRYYMPLTRPGLRPPAAGNFNIIMRTHDRFLAHLEQLEQMTGPRQKTAREAFSQQCGIVGRSIFTHLRSIDLSSSFPYDFMHLIFENLVPNLVLHWTGKFKGIDTGTENYAISPEDWEQVGLLTAAATKTIPSAFCGTLPNIETDRKLFKAEASGFWIQHLAPILLRGKLAEPYYSHLLLIREIILLSLRFEITREQVDQLEQMIHRWILEYEQYYYQYADERLPTCPLTIHGLLHIPYYIRRTGPPWASWAFIMERICGHMLPAVKNRVRPYDHLDNYVERRGQMQVVSKVYNLPTLSKPRVNWRFEYGEEVSSREVIYPEFPGFVLGVPIRRGVPLEQPLTRHLTRYFGPFNEGQTAAQLEARIEADSITRYGRIRLSGDGDRIRTAALIDNDPIARDNSFIKYDLVPDENASEFSGSDHPYLEAQYGRLLDIYHLWFNHVNGTREEFLLGRVQVCETGGLDAGLPQNPYVTFDMDQMVRLSPQMINMKTVVAVVGRVHITGHTWAIVDRSRDSARTQFLDEEGNVEFGFEPE